MGDVILCVVVSPRATGCTGWRQMIDKVVGMVMRCCKTLSPVMIRNMHAEKLDHPLDTCALSIDLHARHIMETF